MTSKYICKLAYQMQAMDSLYSGPSILSPIIQPERKCVLKLKMGFQKDWYKIYIANVRNMSSRCQWWIAGPKTEGTHKLEGF